MNQQDKTITKQATIIELIFASLLCISVNCYTNFANYFSYYLTGIVGIGTVLAGSFVTIFRLWDAITDLGVGSLVDRTNTKIGQFRPWILAGIITSVISTFLLINVPASLPENTALRLSVYIIIYMVFVCGQTMLAISVRPIAQLLTNDPKQRSMIAMIRGVALQILYSILPVIVFSHIVPRTGKFNLTFFRTYWVVISCITVTFAMLAFLALGKKDMKRALVEEKKQKIDIKEMWEVMKGNRPLQMLIISAGSDKLATVCQNNATIVVILYAIVAGNSKLSSGANTYTLIPCLAMILLGLGGVARKFGAKRGMVFGSWGGIIVCVLSILLWVFGDPHTLNYPKFENFTGWSFFTVAFLCLWCLYKGFTLITSNVTAPLIADVIDYEQYRSGKYVPGLIGSLFTFADKVISSFGPTMVSILIAAIGFKNDLPTMDTPFSNKLFAIGLFGMYGIVIIGLIVNLIAMKYYELTPERMKEIRMELNRRKTQE